MKRLLLIVVSFAWIPLVSEEAKACTCREYNVPVCAAYWRADAVFGGQLVDITPVEKSDNRTPTVMLHFIVEQPFRGIGGDRVLVETLHGTSCDMLFVKGERYLIYASRETGGQLFAGPCTRTTDLKHANEDLNYLRALARGDAKEAIMGRLLRDQYAPLTGLRVSVQSGDKTTEVKTDAKGDFSVSVLNPGTYTVRAFIPFAAMVMVYGQDEQGKTNATDTLTTFEYEVQVEKNQCQYRQLNVYQGDLHATAEVSGKVLTASGRPVNPGYVELVHAADSNKSDFKRIEMDGSFKFEGVAVGEYYLVLNPRNQAPSEYDAPYPRTYYPNVSESAAATKIVVTEGAKIEHLTLRVGRPWEERIITGKVVWHDGRTVNDAHVSLYDGDRYVRLVSVDEKGRFTLNVYGDFKYAIIAEEWGRNLGRSERVSIVNGKSTDLVLVLKPRN